MPDAVPSRSTSSGPAPIRHAEQLVTGPDSRAPLKRASTWSAAVNEVTQILSAIAQGDPSAASQLLPLVYDELRGLAAQKLAHEHPGQTLQPTALVHEAYLRLVGTDSQP